MKEKILTLPSPFGDSITLFKNVWDGGKMLDTLSIVGGLHGNQINGLYVASRLTQFLNAVWEEREKAYRIKGKIQIFPVVNLQALQAGTRFWSFDGLDFDMAFPGNENGELNEKICHTLINHTADSTYGIVLSTGTIHYEDFPHIRIYRPDRSLKKIARSLDFGIVREIPESPANNIQLLHQWTVRDIGSLLLVCGKADALARDHCDTLIKGIINMMVATGFISHTGEKGQKSETTFYESSDEKRIAAKQPGLFTPEARVGDTLKQGQRIGLSRDIYSGEVVEEFFAPTGGFLVTLRDYPLIYEKETVAWILMEKKSLRLWPF